MKKFAAGGDGKSSGARARGLLCRVGTGNNGDVGQFYALPVNVRCVFSRNPGSLAIDVPPSETTRWRAVARVLRSPLDAISCTLFPACCTLCGTPLPQIYSAPICDACWGEMPLVEESACRRCGDVLDTETDECRACLLTPPAFERAVSCFHYRGRMRDAIHALKYERVQPAAKMLGRMLAAAIAQLHGAASAEMLVVPVPLYWRRKSQRGFNQTRLLARYALVALRRSHPQWRLRLASGALLRTRNTMSQFELSSHQRRANMRGAFRVSSPVSVRGKHILLVDDILTTGATARACARALIEAGAESVWVATLARARRAADLPSNINNPELPGGQLDEPLTIADMYDSSSPSFT